MDDWVHDVVHGDGCMNGLESVGMAERLLGGRDRYILCYWSFVYVKDCA